MLLPLRACCGKATRLHVHSLGPARRESAGVLEFSKLFRMSALRAGAAMKTKRGIDTVAKLASEGGAREVETSLERLRPTSCLTGNAEKQKSVCGKVCQRQRQHGRVHFMESVKRSVPILK